MCVCLCCKLRVVCSRACVSDCVLQIFVHKIFTQNFVAHSVPRLCRAYSSYTIVARICSTHLSNTIGTHICCTHLLHTFVEHNRRTHVSNTIVTRICRTQPAHAFAARICCTQSSNTIVARICRHTIHARNCRTQLSNTSAERIRRTIRIRRTHLTQEILARDCSTQSSTRRTELSHVLVELNCDTKLLYVIVDTYLSPKLSYELVSLNSSNAIKRDPRTQSSHASRAFVEQICRSCTQHCR